MDKEYEEYLREKLEDEWWSDLENEHDELGDDEC